MKLEIRSRNFSYFRCMFRSMKPFAIISLLFLSLISLPASGQEKQVIVPYTLADRDRAILTEAKITAFEARMEIRFGNIENQFKSQQKQIDDLKTLFYGGFSILITLFLFMFGYMIWDRRTAYSKLPTLTDCQLPAADCRLPTTDYRLPRCQFQKLFRVRKSRICRCLIPCGFPAANSSMLITYLG